MNKLTHRFPGRPDISVSCEGCVISVPCVMYINILLGTPGHFYFVSKINVQNNRAVTNIVRRKQQLFCKNLTVFDKVRAKHLYFNLFLGFVLPLI